jgi:hypothetical protein
LSFLGTIVLIIGGIFLIKDKIKTRTIKGKHNIGNNK